MSKLGDIPYYDGAGHICCNVCRKFLNLLLFEQGTNITSQILFIGKLKQFLMLCGEVQNVQTLLTNTHTFARREITLVL